MDGPGTISGRGAVVRLHSPQGDLVTVCGRWVGRDSGERTQQETLTDRAGASWRGRSVVRWVAQAPTLPSGWEWNGSQPGQGAAELGFPWPAPGEMQVEATRRASEPSGQSVLVVTTCSPRPMWAGQGAITCTASHAALAAKRPEGVWFSPTPYLRSRMAFSTSAWRRWSASSSRVSPSRSVMKP